jgi:hypothetical protein
MGYNWGYQMEEEEEMKWTCSTYGREMKCIQGLGGEI